MYLIKDLKDFVTKEKDRCDGYDFEKVIQIARNTGQIKEVFYIKENYSDPKISTCSFSKLLRDNIQVAVLGAFEDITCLDKAYMTGEVDRGLIPGDLEPGSYKTFINHLCFYFKSYLNLFLNTRFLGDKKGSDIVDNCPTVDFRQKLSNAFFQNSLEFVFEDEENEIELKINIILTHSLGLSWKRIGKIMWFDIKKFRYAFVGFEFKIKDQNPDNHLFPTINMQRLFRKGSGIDNFASKEFLNYFVDYEKTIRYMNSVGGDFFFEKINKIMDGI